MKVFMTGATGYIGGSVAATLIERGDTVFGLTRGESGEASLKEMGVIPVLGTLKDERVVRAGIENVDAVINAADADNPWVVRTIIEALAGSGRPFLHTSGSSIVGDRSNGEFSDVLHSDRDQVIPLFEKAGRVGIDRAVAESASRAIRPIIFCPTMIYGRGRGQKRTSVQLPMLIALARESGCGRHIGRGLNVWSNVHIDDVVGAYLAALDRPETSGFFFLGAGEANFHDLASAISKSLGYGGATKTIKAEDVVMRFSPEAAIFALGSNSRVRADRTREVLNWTPSGPGIFATIDEAVSMPS
jgi:nucleoside-diphosphate-sugar epimerase